ncbi:MAG TPA: 5'-nucleotidase C-terminal domain-containing protein [Candidatus Limnocylindria bacterium]|nr:5'-nucleotidase C-terminal domain-containing protein [Candidatus Limnocylindria bacterium]
MHRLALVIALAACATASRPSPPATTELLVAATTDVHGWLRGWDYYANAADTTRGLSRAATIVDSLRAAHPERVILVDAGDLLQGNPLAYTAARVSSDTVSPIVSAMNAMRYDAAAIGNHEFNYGVPFLDRAVGQARFAFLSANTYGVDGIRKYRAWTMVERAGARVAIVGGTTPGVNVWDRDNVRGRVTVRAIIPDVRASVREARQQGADVVVVVLHSGLSGTSSYDTTSTGAASENVTAQVARDVEGIDLIVFGHSHREVADTVIGTTMLMQPRNWAGSVAVAHLELRRSNGRWTVGAKRGEIVRTAGRRESDAVLAATARAHAEAVRYVTTAVGRTTVAWRADSSRVTDTPIVDFILETQRRAAGAQLASTAAFSLEASLDAGDITVAELARLYPYDNTLRSIRITGKQLREYLEFSARYFGTAATSEPAVDPRMPGYNYDIVAGADYTIDVSRPAGSRITRLEVDGRPVRDEDSFTFALNNYRHTGGGGYAMLAGAPVLYESTSDIRHLLIEEVRRRGTLEPADVFRRNWELVPPAAIGAAYAAMHRGAIAPATPTTIPVARVGPLPRRVRIIATNDFHGTLEPRVDARGVRRGGAGAVAAVIARARTECAGCAVLLLDGGDMFQGTAASNLVFGRSVVAIYDALGYTASALGNHEFDWGQDTLRARMWEARYAILGANVRYADGRDVPWIRDDTLVDVSGVRVGIVGVATVETPRTTLAANVSDLRFVDPVPVVIERARSLRARGAHLVAVVAHAGAFCDDEGDDRCRGEIVELARGVGRAVDVIVSGHTHSLVRTLDPGVPIVQARSNGRAVGVVDLVPGEIPVVSVRDVLTDSVAPLSRIDSMARRAIDQVAPRVSARVADISTHLQRSGEQYPLGHLVADAQRWAAKADVAVMNNGGIRADLPAGTATYGRIFEAQPFANTLHRYTLRGSDLRAYFEKIVGGPTPPRVHVSGVTLSYDPRRPSGQRIVALRLADGRAIADDAHYTLVMNNFMATGGDGLALGAEAVRSEPLPIIDLDAFIDYLKQLPQPVRAPTGRRIIEVGT